jgi:AcrR family transcriptional regulator
MTAAAKSKKRAEAPRLSPDDWLDAAYTAVAEGGFDSVRVLVLADALGVTRGSFYWHFTDHAALITALLARWREREIAVHMRLKAEAELDPRADLERLLDVALSHAGDDLQNMRFELALRGLGRRDTGVASMLVEIDEMRLGLFVSKFMRLTGDANKANGLAVLFYLAIVGGNQALSRPFSTEQSKQFIKDIIAQYLIHMQGPAPAAADAAG